jgi:DNA-binding transcriptional MerR regulator
MLAQILKYNDIKQGDTIKVVTDMGSISGVVLIVTSEQLTFKVPNMKKIMNLTPDDLLTCDVYLIAEGDDPVAIMDELDSELEHQRSIGFGPDTNEPTLADQEIRFFELYEAYVQTGVGEGREIYQEMQELSEILNLGEALSQVREDKIDVIKSKDKTFKAIQEQESDQKDQQDPKDFTENEIKFNAIAKEYNELGFSVSDIERAVILYSQLNQCTQKERHLEAVLDTLVKHRSKKRTNPLNGPENRPTGKDNKGFYDLAEQYASIDYSPSNREQASVLYEKLWAMTDGDANLVSAMASIETIRETRHGELQENESEFALLLQKYNNLYPSPSEIGTNMYIKLLDMATTPELKELLDEAVDARNHRIKENSDEAMTVINKVAKESQAEKTSTDIEYIDINDIPTTGFKYNTEEIIPDMEQLENIDTITLISISGVFGYLLELTPQYLKMIHTDGTMLIELSRNDLIKKLENDEIRIHASLDESNLWVDIRNPESIEPGDVIKITGNEPVVVTEYSDMLKTIKMGSLTTSRNNYNFDRTNWTSSNIKKLVGKSSVQFGFNYSIQYIINVRDIEKLKTGYITQVGPTTGHLKIDLKSSPVMYTIASPTTNRGISETVMKKYVEEGEVKLHLNKISVGMPDLDGKQFEFEKATIEKLQPGAVALFVKDGITILPGVIASNKAGDIILYISELKNNNATVAIAIDKTTVSNMLDLGLVQVQVQ